MKKSRTKLELNLKKAENELKFLRNEEIELETWEQKYISAKKDLEQCKGKIESALKSTGQNLPTLTVFLDLVAELRKKNRNVDNEYEPIEYSVSSGTKFMQHGIFSNNSMEHIIYSSRNSIKTSYK